MHRAASPGAPPSGRGGARGSGGSDDTVLSGPLNRILVVDDSPSIHADFREILAMSQKQGLEALSDLFAEGPAPAAASMEFEIDSAFQGQEGLKKVERAVADNRRYSVCFLDVRMPPGWDGPETLSHLWDAAPDLQVVLCTAYSDVSWHDLMARHGRTDRLLILKKPFEVPEVRQLARALTEKWRLARKNEERLAALERGVAERTRELNEANQQLRREMQERARAQNELNKRHRLEALGRLAAGLGHEVNNPLSFVVGSIESALTTISDTELADDTRRDLDESLGDALIGTDRIAQLVRSINHFIRPGDDVRQPIDIVPTIQLAMAMVKNDLEDHVELEADLRAGLPPVLGRPIELEQVFVNLLKNAIHSVSSSSRGDARIRIATHCDDAQAVVTITDTGMGIDEAHLDKIFDPFFTTKPVGQGTGLGLSVCHAIVSAMGGNIELCPGKSGGTVVTVQLPTLSSPLPTPVSSGVESLGCRGRILVVDDEPLIRKVVTFALRDHDVVAVGNGRDALACCLDQEFDLIFCDLMMPEVSGMDLYRMLEQSCPEAVDKVVFITGGALLEDVTSFLSEVPNECLEKPIPAKVLQRHVNERLGAKDRSRRHHPTQ